MQNISAKWWMHQNKRCKAVLPKWPGNERRQQKTREVKIDKFKHVSCHGNVSDYLRKELKLLEEIQIKDEESKLDDYSKPVKSRSSSLCIGTTPEKIGMEIHHWMKCQTFFLKIWNMIYHINLLPRKEIFFSQQAGNLLHSAPKQFRLKPWKTLHSILYEVTLCQ